MKELADFAWFPQWMRAHQQDYLGFLASRFGMYTPVSELLERLLLQTPAPYTWTDACSGNGAAALSVFKVLTLPCTLHLTDKYPGTNRLPCPAKTLYDSRPLDITTTLPDGKGPVTLFNALHHFDTPGKKVILQRVAQAKRPFMSVEILIPDALGYGAVFLAATIGQWLFAPFIKPFSPWRLFFTYIVPVHIATVWIDGWISVYKSPGKKAYTDLLHAFETKQDYRFRVMRIKDGWKRLTILEGAVSTR